MTQKPLVKGEPSRMLYVRLPASQWRLLCDTAKARKKTVSQVVRDALTAHGVTDSSTTGSTLPKGWTHCPQCDYDG